MQENLMRSVIGMSCALMFSGGVAAESCKGFENALVGLYDDPVSVAFSVAEPGAPLKKGDVLAQEILVVVNKGWRLQQTISDSEGNMDLFQPGDMVYSVSLKGQQKYCAMRRDIQSLYCFSDTDDDSIPDTLDGGMPALGTGQKVDAQPVELVALKDSLSASVNPGDLPIFSLIVGRRLVATKVKRKYVELAIAAGTDIITMKTTGFDGVHYYGKDHKTRVDAAGPQSLKIDGFDVTLEDGALTGIKGSFLTPEVALECEGRRLRFKDSEFTGGIY